MGVIDVVQLAKDLDSSAESLSNTFDGVAFLDYIYKACPLVYTAGDLLQFFRCQLPQFPVQDFDFLFEGVEFFGCFYEEVSPFQLIIHHFFACR